MLCLPEGATHIQWHQEATASDASIEADWQTSRSLVDEKVSRPLTQINRAGMVSWEADELTTSLLPVGRKADTIWKRLH